MSRCDAEDGSEDSRDFEIFIYEQLSGRSNAQSVTDVLLPPSFKFPGCVFVVAVCLFSFRLGPFS